MALSLFIPLFLSRDFIPNWREETRNHKFHYRPWSVVLSHSLNILVLGYCISTGPSPLPPWVWHGALIFSGADDMSRLERFCLPKWITWTEVMGMAALCDCYFLILFLVCLVLGKKADSRSTNTTKKMKRSSCPLSLQLCCTNPT